MSYDHDKFKRLRNNFQKYDGQYIIGHALEKLRSGNDPNLMKKWNGWLPWHLMMIIRWTHQYGEAGGNLPQFTEANLRDFYNQVHDLKTDIHFDGIAQGQVVDEFFRRTIWFQLPYQMRMYELGASFGRQLILFVDLGEKYNLSELFRGVTGLTVLEFLECHFGMWAVFELDPNARWIDYRNSQLIPVDQWERFFRYLGKNYLQSRDFIRKHVSGPITERLGIEFQLHEHTPFERYPIYMVEDRPHIAYQRLSLVCMDCGILKRPPIYSAP
ncbi:MAG: hypothetical protein V4735_08985 [Pseudomonadota bacterium]